MDYTRNVTIFIIRIFQLVCTNSVPSSSISPYIVFPTKWDSSHRYNSIDLDPLPLYIYCTNNW